MSYKRAAACPCSVFTSACGPFLGFPLHLNESEIHRFNSVLMRRMGGEEPEHSSQLKVDRDVACIFVRHI